MRKLPYDPSSARLYALVARKARRAVVFRRGPSKWTQLLAWDLKTDALTPGQWIKARVYERRCDLSPDGRLLATFLGKHSGPYGTWTAISRPPYFTALALWPKGDCWGGGGLFESDQRFGLNHWFASAPSTDCGAPAANEAPERPRASRDCFGRRRHASVTKVARNARRAEKTARDADVTPTPSVRPLRQSLLAKGYEPPRWFDVVPVCEFAKLDSNDCVMAARREREGWRRTRGSGPLKDWDGPVWISCDAPDVWRRPLASGRVLALREEGIDERGGRWNVESGAIEDGAGAVLRELGRVDFLDADHNGDALWGWEGKVWRLKGADPRAVPKLVADLNAMTPVTQPSPDWAREWP